MRAYSPPDPPCACRREHRRHRVIDQDVAVGQEKDLGTAVFAGSVPAAVPQLPADLESHAGLAGASGQCGKDAFLTQQDRFDF